VITSMPDLPPPAEPTPAAATVITSMPNLPPQFEPSPAAATVITPRPEIPTAPPQPPPQSAATIISNPFEPPPTLRPSAPPPPSPPPPAQSAPAAPTVMMTSPPVAQPSQMQRSQIPASKVVGPPNLKRYLIGALAIALLVSIAGAIFFFWPGKKSPDVQTPTTTTTTTTSTGTTTTPTPPNPSPGVTTGRLIITSEPPGAKVFVQGEQKGVTPLELSALPFGKYALKLQMDGFKDVDQEVEVSAENSAASLPVTLEKAGPVAGTLVVESVPPNAFIVMGNRVLGVTPKKLPNTKAGKYNITLRKEGYQDFSGTVRVVQDKSVTFTGQLVEIPKPPPVVEQPVVKKQEIAPGSLVTLGPGVTPPKSIKKTYAKYPNAARERRVQGTVQMSILVSETGKVLDVKLVKSAHTLLDEVSLAAVRDWIFEPATKEGVPVKVWIPVSMTYQFK
jgi:TonB family protein